MDLSDFSGAVQTPFATEIATLGVSGGKRGSFHQPVLDSKKRRVKGLTKNGETFYGRITFRLKSGKRGDWRIKLRATTLAEARLEYAALRLNPPPPPVTSVATVAPLRFSEMVPIYLERAGLAKRATTVATESIHLNHWKRAAFQDRSLREISKENVLAGRDLFLKKGWSPRTANLSVTVLRNLFRQAIDCTTTIIFPCDDD